MVDKSPAVLDDAYELFLDLQEVQVEELIASHGPLVLNTILNCIDKSYEATTFRYKGKLLGINGIVSVSIVGGLASPWLLTTNESLKYPKSFGKETKLYIDKWMQEYDTLISFIDSRYDKALRWAEWAGFTVHPPVPYGVNGELFNPIELRR